MRKLWLAIFLFAVFSVTGCISAVSTNPNDYIGEYVFKPNNAAPGDFASFIILKQDHTALEIRFSKDTGQIQTTPGRWYLDRGTDEEVVIDKRAYPIHSSDSTIRLTINEVGQYYEKVR
ncbi:MAG: hypothetical protein ABI383_13005 [Acidobacteriaceae bacterium]